MSALVHKLTSFARRTLSSNSISIVKHAQTTNTVLLVPPNEYAGWNSEAAKDNKFMANLISSNIQKHFHSEYNIVVQALQSANINVIQASVGTEDTPDCIFPNNWLSIHDNGQAVIYPMKVLNRRLEIRSDIIQQLQDCKYIHSVYDMSGYANEDLFFEGTGALVLDRENKWAFVNQSQRSYAQLAVEWCNHFGYHLVLFEAYDAHGYAIYHTNVMMSVGSTFAVICLDCIKGELSKQYLLHVLRDECNKDIIEITMEQMSNYCANVLELETEDDDGNKGQVLVMSDRAYLAFEDEQIKRLENQHGLILVHPNIENIEIVCGGGIRCMIAEVFSKAI